MANQTDLDQEARAREWLAASECKWRLQTMQMRGRYNPKTGEYRRLPDRLRRFLNGTPVGMVHVALETLVKSAPYRSPVYNWEYDASLLYRPTVTSIVKDGTPQASNTKDATYTIIQDLRLCTDDDDWIGFLDGSECSRVSSAEYKWDEAEIEDCPPAGQGVSWQIVNVSRDSETDLFSYTVRKSVAVTQHSPETTVKCSDRVYSTLETWDNVYGAPGEWRWDSELNGGGPISIPNPCDAETGVSIDVDYSENQDCTYKFSVRRTYADELPGAAWSRQMDQYRIQDMGPA